MKIEVDATKSFRFWYLQVVVLALVLEHVVDTEPVEALLMHEGTYRVVFDKYSTIESMPTNVTVWIRA